MVRLRRSESARKSIDVRRQAVSDPPAASIMAGHKQVAVEINMHAEVSPALGGQRRELHDAL